MGTLGTRRIRLKSLADVRSILVSRKEGGLGDGRCRRVVGRLMRELLKG